MDAFSLIALITCIAALIISVLALVKPEWFEPSAWRKKKDNGQKND